MSAYPVLYEADYIEKRNRLTVFFRALLIIPHAIMSIFLGIAVTFTVIAAWFGMVFTGRYPEGLYEFNAGATRWLSRYSAYAYLQVDKFPPFGLADDPAYPVRVHFAGPLPAYSRLKAFFRIILAIPLMVIVYALSIALAFVTLAAWVVAVILGRMPRGLYDALDFCIAYTMKGYAYLALLTETYPPFSNENATLEGAGGSTALGAAPGAFAPPNAGLPPARPGGLEG